MDDGGQLGRRCRPNPGDDLAFPLGAAQTSNVNDFAAGTAFRSIDVHGNYLQLVWQRHRAGRRADRRCVYGRAVADRPARDPRGRPDVYNIAGGYSFTGSVDLNGHALTVNSVVGDTFAGPITGTGSLTFNGGNSNRLTAVNTFTGPTTVNESWLDVNGTLPGPVTVAVPVRRVGTLYGTGTVGTSDRDRRRTVPRPACELDRRRHPEHGRPVGRAGRRDVVLRRRYRVVDEHRRHRHGPCRRTARPLRGTGYQARARRPIYGHQQRRHRPGRRHVHGRPGRVGFVGPRLGARLRITYHGGDGNDVVITAVPAPAFRRRGRGRAGCRMVNVYDAAGELIAASWPTPRASAAACASPPPTSPATASPTSSPRPAPAAGRTSRSSTARTFAVVREFFAYDAAFTGGVFVAAGDVNGDGNADIITGAGRRRRAARQGLRRRRPAPCSTASSPTTPAFRGGVSVAGRAYVERRRPSPPTSSPGPAPAAGRTCGSSTARRGALTPSSSPTTPAFRGGVQRGRPTARSTLATRGLISAGRTILVGTSRRPRPAAAARRAPLRCGPGAGRRFLAYAPAFFGGVALGMQPIATGGGLSVLTGAGPGGGPHVKAFSRDNPLALLLSFLAFDPAFIGGVFVG